MPPRSMQFQDATQAVAVATRAIFERWTALKLVIEHQFGGAPYEANQLLDKTVSMATNPSKRHSVDDYIELFYSTFERMNTDIEDSSPEEVAALVVNVRDAAVMGNFAPALDVAQKAGISAQAFQASVQGARDSDDEEDDPDYNPGPRTRSQAIVDEDGFTEVRTRRRNR